MAATLSAFQPVLYHFANFSNELLCSCMQQGLLAFDSRQASGQHLEPTPLIIFPHQQVDIVSSCTQQVKSPHVVAGNAASEL